MSSRLLRFAITFPARRHPNMSDKCMLNFKAHAQIDRVRQLNCSHIMVVPHIPLQLSNEPAPYRQVRTELPPRYNLVAQHTSNGPNTREL